MSETESSGTYYAWTTITTGVDEAGRPTKDAVPGDEVSAGSLNLTDEQFEELVEAGAVREDQYPSGLVIGTTVSPTEYMKLQAGVAEGEVDPSVLKDAEKVKSPDFQSPDVAGEKK